MTSLDPNAWFWCILLALLLVEGLEQVSAWLNLRALSERVPEAMADTYEPEAYARAQAYARANARLGRAEGLASLVLLLGFWWLGGFGWLDAAVRGWGLGPVATGLAYFALIFAASRALSLPLEIYRVFVIEERFGFNRATPRLFAADEAKRLVLSALVGLPLLALVLWIFQTLPLAWLWGWAAVTLISLLLAYVAPAWIMPWFNRFQPLEDGPLKEAIHAMARDCGFPLREVSVMDGSRRSAKSNAFFTGWGRNKRIALFDTLVERHGVEELVAVLAHEIGHYRKGHIWKGLALGIASTGLLFFLLGQVLESRGLFDAFGVAETSVYLSLVFFGILALPLQQLLAVLGNWWSRRWETEADAYAARVTGDPGAMARALKKLSRDNLSNLTPHPFHVFLHHSHPPVLSRLEALERAGG